MKKIFFVALLCLLGKDLFAQKVAVNWNVLRLFESATPSFYVGTELNTPNSERKTLQLSAGYGFWGYDFYIDNTPLAIQTIRWGIEQKYFLYERWKKGYFSYAFEARHSKFVTERWVTNCNTGDCFEEIITYNRIRNAYNLMGRVGYMNSIGKIFYYDLFTGIGLKFTKKTDADGAFSLNQPFKVAHNHYLYPAFSLGFRVGFILK